MESKKILRMWAVVFVCLAVFCTGLPADPNERDEPNQTEDTTDSNDCVYKDCIVQEISIFQMRGPRGVSKYFYKHVRTNIAPIDSNGVINDERSADMNPDRPQDAAPGIPELIHEAEAALGQSLEDMLNVTRNRRGTSTHSFGCADECPCVKRNETVTLPNGKVVPLPEQVVSSGYPPHRNAVPGNDCPVAVIEKRVTIPGKGTYLLTYHIRLYGTVRRYRGDCTK